MSSEEEHQVSIFTQIRVHIPIIRNKVDLVWDPKRRDKIEEGLKLIEEGICWWKDGD